MASNQQLDKHLKRWENWNRELELQKMKVNSREEFGEYANKIVQKLNKPLDKAIENSLKHEVESINSCGVCLDIMMSPKEPYSLYPCGHSFCKICLFKGKDPKNTHNLNLRTCPYCRQKIQGCAINLSLLQMIRKSEEVTKVEGFDKESINIRYSIISKQLKEMKSKLHQLTTQLGIKQRVDKRLAEDKAEVKKEMEKLIEQDNLIDNHRSSLNHEMKILRQLIQSTTEKYLLLQNTHEEIRIDKDKNCLLDK